MTTPPNQRNEEIIEKLIEEYCSFWDKNNPLLESSKKLLKEAMLLIANVKDSLHAQALKKIQREGAKAIEILMKQISEQEERHRGEKKGSFEIYGEMCRKNLDIKLAPLSNIVEAKLTKLGGEVTIGVTPDVIHDLARGRQFSGGLLLADLETFEQLKKLEDGNRNN